MSAVSNMEGRWNMESRTQPALCKGRKKDLVKEKLMKTVEFDLDNLTDDKYEHEGVWHEARPGDFTIEDYQKKGLEKVLLFDCEPEEIGMKIPPNTYTPRDVMEKVGENRAIQFIKVSTAETFSNSFKAFVEYIETPPENRVQTYNVISLEVSGTEMQDLVSPPSLVHQLDLASYWPDERKQRRTTFETQDNLTLFAFDNQYPRVENFCLMSAASSYTGFHIDFHGSSVWYHVLTGRKIFFLIEPTDENIRKYEEYLLDESDDSFFGDHVDQCTRLVVEAGQTLILPAGWIHAVFTPVDSLVFGGNFIHPRSLKMQMKIVEHEERLELQKNDKYPQADEVFLHYMDHVVEKVTGRRHIRPTTRNRQQEGLQYVGEEFVKERRHHRIPQKKDFDRRRRESWITETVEESEEYEKAMEILDKYDNVDVENLDMDEFFIAEDPLMLYHPESFEVEASFHGTNPCGLPLPPSLHEENANMTIDKDVLQELMHPSEIVQWESLIEALLNKQEVNIPVGCTRPNSLVYSFYCLVKKLRYLNASRSNANPRKVYVPESSVTLQQEWENIVVDDENQRRKRPVQPPQKKPRKSGLRQKKIKSKEDQIAEDLESLQFERGISEQPSETNVSVDRETSEEKETKPLQKKLATPRRKKGKVEEHDEDYADEENSPIRRRKTVTQLRYGNKSKEIEEDMEDVDEENPLIEREFSESPPQDKSSDERETSDEEYQPTPRRKSGTTRGKKVSAEDDFSEDKDEVKRSVGRRQGVKADQRKTRTPRRKKSIVEPDTAEDEDEDQLIQREMSDQPTTPDRIEQETAVAKEEENTPKRNRKVATPRRNKNKVEHETAEEEEYVKSPVQKRKYQRKKKSNEDEEDISEYVEKPSTPKRKYQRKKKSKEEEEEEEEEENVDIEKSPIQKRQRQRKNKSKEDKEEEEDVDVEKSPTPKRLRQKKKVSKYEDDLENEDFEKPSTPKRKYQKKNKLKEDEEDIPEYVEKPSTPKRKYQRKKKSKDEEEEVSEDVNAEKSPTSKRQRQKKKILMEYEEDGEEKDVDVEKLSELAISEQPPQEGDNAERDSSEKSSKRSTGRRKRVGRPKKVKDEDDTSAKDAEENRVEREASEEVFKRPYHRGKIVPRQKNKRDGVEQDLSEEGDENRSPKASNGSQVESMNRLNGAPMPQCAAKISFVAAAALAQNLLAPVFKESAAMARAGPRYRSAAVPTAPGAATAAAAAAATRPVAARAAAAANTASGCPKNVGNAAKEEKSRAYLEWLGGNVPKIDEDEAMKKEIMKNLTVPKTGFDYTKCEETENRIQRRRNLVRP